MEQGSDEARERAREGAGERRREAGSKPGVSGLSEMTSHPELSWVRKRARPEELVSDLCTGLHCFLRELDPRITGWIHCTVVAQSFRTLT